MNTIIKTNNKIYIFLFLVLFSSGIYSGCEKNIDTTNNNTNISADSNLNLAENVKTMIHSKTSSDKIGLYINDNITTTSTSDLTTSMLLLVDYNSEYSQWKSFYDENQKYSDTFLNLFNNEWDTSLIDSIAEEDTRQMFQTIADSYGKVSRFEESVYIENDFSRIGLINNIDSTVLDYSQLLDKTITLSDTNYNTDNIQNELSDLILEAENIYKETKYGYLKDLLEVYIQGSFSAYFFGNEHYSPFDFNTNYLTDSFIEHSNYIIENHPDSYLADLSKKFLRVADENENKVSIEYADLVLNYKTFGLDSDMSLSIDHVNSDNLKLNDTKVIFSNSDNKFVEAKINTTINDLSNAIKIKLRWKNDLETDYSLSIYNEFSSKKYLSLNFSGLATNKEALISEGSTLATVFDLSNGERTTLSDILGENYENASKKIKTQINERFKSQNFSNINNYSIDNKFYISGNNLIFMFDKGEYSNEQTNKLYINIAFEDIELLDFLENKLN